MLNIVVFVSGGGTNLQALIDACEQGKIKNGKIAAVLSSNAKAYALTRAKKHGIPYKVISRKACVNAQEHTQKVLSFLEEVQADLIVLAGFMSILSKEVTDLYAYKIINIHPSLIPSFCGNGFYGLKVHQAALNYGVKVTGATVHFVNEITDGGAIILQKPVFVHRNDTAEILQKRVMEQAEWDILPKAVSLFCESKLQIVNNHVIVEEE